MTEKPTLTDLKKELRKKTPNELVEEIAHLYKKIQQCKYSHSYFPLN